MAIPHHHCCYKPRPMVGSTRSFPSFCARLGDSRKSRQVPGMLGLGPCE